MDTLVKNGCDVIDVGLVTTTPTLGICTKKMNASGSIMISASHNDEKWNALKLLDNNGEFLSPEKEVSLIIEEKEEKLKNQIPQAKYENIIML